MTENKAFYTDDELITRLWDKEKVRDIMARHSYYMANNWHREELNELWVQRYDNKKTASFGNNFGYYVGMDEISNYYVVQNNERYYQWLKEYSDAREDVEYSSLNLGIGQMRTHTVNTHLVEISDDGLTAQYCACDNGQVTYGKPDGTADAYYLGGMVFADLIKEGDEWKIWHLKICHDHTCSAKASKGGGGFGQMPIMESPGADGAPGGAPGGPGGAPDGPGGAPGGPGGAPGGPGGAPGGPGGPPGGPGGQEEDLGPDPYLAEFGTPTIEMDAYLPKYGWTFLPEMMPVPFEYFDSRKGFGPDGQKKYVLF